MTRSVKSVSPEPLRLRVGNDLTVRLFEPQDAQQLYELTACNRAHLARWMGWIDGVQTISDTETFLREAEAAAQEQRSFTAGVWLRGVLVGAVSLHDVDWTNRCASIGYWLDESHNGLGIMTRTVKALCDYAFRDLHLHRLQIRVVPENHRSRRIAERLGFTFEGVLRAVQFIRGRYVDHALYALLRDEAH